MEVPVANQGCPLASGRCFRIDGGSSLPCTSEKLTPPCSNTLPSRMTRERPPPPSGRSQLSSAKRPTPSRRSSPAQISSWRPSTSALARSRESAGGGDRVEATGLAVALVDAGVAADADEPFRRLSKERTMDAMPRELKGTFSAHAVSRQAPVKDCHGCSHLGSAPTDGIHGDRRASHDSASKDC